MKFQHCFAPIWFQHKAKSSNPGTWTVQGLRISLEKNWTISLFYVFWLKEFSNSNQGLKSTILSIFQFCHNGHNFTLDPLHGIWTFLALMFSFWNVYKLNNFALKSLNSCNIFQIKLNQFECVQNFVEKNLTLIMYKRYWGFSFGS